MPGPLGGDDIKPDNPDYLGQYFDDPNAGGAGFSPVPSPVANSPGAY